MKIQSFQTVTVSFIAMLLLGFNSFQAKGFDAIELRSGHLMDAGMTGESIEKINLEKLLLERNFEPDMDPDDALEERSPASGKAFVILEVMLKEGKSIGKYDYRIQFPDAEESFACIGMAVGDAPFDPRLWELTPEDAGIDPVRLLYEIEAAEGEVELVLTPALGLTIRPERVSFTVEGVDVE